MEHGLEAAARWLGILTTGLLVGSEDEESAKLLQKVVGGPALADLRHWFASADPAASRDARIAVIEACIAIVRADRAVGDVERDAIERIVMLSELDEEAQASLRKHVDEDVPLDGIAPRLAHPALREALLVLTWQIAKADGRVQDAEAGLYGMLADKLGVTPTRASELRSILGKQ
ncbi:MAG: TerB family tellurite resistance protein [Sandaracinus sp.]